MPQQHQLPDLPYPMDALEPYISRETLAYHYGKHHSAYVKKLNKSVQETAFFGKTLEEIIVAAQGPMFNNAAQAWNHAFYWQCLSPHGGGEPKQKISRVLENDFGSVQDFQKRFTESANALFGSGWTWLVMGEKGKLEIVNTQNADTPIRLGQIPLLTCDVWEHAYYLDYQNVRADYLRAFWKLVNWAFVDEQYSAAAEAHVQRDSQSEIINQPHIT